MLLPEISRSKIILTILCCLAAMISLSCSFSTQREKSTVINESLKSYPQIILWAWERPENLEFLDTKKFGVAFLAQTLILEGDKVIIRQRHQPLKIPPDIFLIAVTRIETNKQVTVLRPSLSDAQKTQLVNAVTQTLNLPHVKAVQIDFDALRSERNFYQSFLKDLRSTLPGNVSLTITALASWCAADDWVSNLPVDEAVPMVFQMGADSEKIRLFLGSESDWQAPICRSSYGAALDEPLRDAKLRTHRRFYIFNNRSWRAEDLNRISAEFAQN